MEVLGLSELNRTDRGARVEEVIRTACLTDHLADCGMTGWEYIGGYL